MFLANESMRLGTQQAQLVCLYFCYCGFATSKAAYSFQGQRYSFQGHPFQESFDITFMTNEKNCQNISFFFFFFSHKNFLFPFFQKLFDQSIDDFRSLSKYNIIYIYIYIYIDTLYIRGFLSFNWTYMWFKNIIITEW